MTQRREFLKKAGGTLAMLSLAPLFDTAYGRSFNSELEKITDLTPSQAATNEDFWGFIQNSFTTSSNLINLNNGGVSPQPKVVQDAFVRYNEMSNEAPSYYMWQILDKGRESIRDELAELAGCGSDEVCINRNTTESLETIIFGLDLKKGDEVVLSKFDYPNMLHSWNQSMTRDGIVLKFIELDMPMEDDDEIVKRFTDAMTNKTKIVHVTHMINWTGQILPAKKITAAAHERGAEVILDGAHGFAHIPTNLKDIDCDYYGTSLHKWLCAPFGTGMMFVKKEKIAKLWTMFAHEDPKSDDIRKFETLGTRSFPAEQAIANALKFHHMIGSERKQARLHYLKNYWIDKVKGMPGVNIYTSQKADYSCALATVGVQDKAPAVLLKFLMKEYKIHTTPVIKENVSGVRITPHVYTRLADLDRFVKAMEEFTS